MIWFRRRWVSGATAADQSGQGDFRSLTIRTGSRLSKKVTCRERRVRGQGAASYHDKSNLLTTLRISPISGRLCGQSRQSRDFTNALFFVGYKWVADKPRNITLMCHYYLSQHRV